MIPVFHDERHRLHRPDFFLARGHRAQNRETPERADMLVQALREAGYGVAGPAEFGPGPRVAVHTARYLEFLETAHAQWSVLDEAGPEVVANAFPIGPHASRPGSVVGRAGFHMADMACPIGADTWQAACASADVALSAAAAVRSGSRAAYALCRPPGHHAFADRAAGYCFLNNAAIAAQYLLGEVDRAAILDIDVHHGNGTQDIFYHRSDVLFVSLHADPASYYPFFWGYADQEGVGEGMGFTMNLPLPLGTADSPYLSALARALERIEAFDAGALIVSLGLDTFAGDPYAAFGITTGGFERIGAAIGALRMPTVLIQEGGYVAPALGDNLIAFLRGFQA